MYSWAGVFEHLLEGADVAVDGVDDAEADDFVEVEAVAVEVGEEVEGEVEVVSGEGGCLVGGEFFEGDDGAVVVELVDVEEVGNEPPFDLDEGGVESGVVGR